MAHTLDAVGEFIAHLAAVPELPFPVRIPERDAKPVGVFWNQLFGGWSGAE